MKASFLSYSLYLCLIPHALAISSDPCTTTTTLPTITVSQGANGFINQYTHAFEEFFAGGLRPKVYTITQTCPDMRCGPPPAQTAPPPGFTCALVKCTKCGGDGPRTETLTFPIESLEAYASSGYMVASTQTAQSNQESGSQRVNPGGSSPPVGGNNSPGTAANDATSPTSKAGSPVNDGISPASNSGSVIPDGKDVSPVAEEDAHEGKSMGSNNSQSPTDGNSGHMEESAQKAPEQHGSADDKQSSGHDSKNQTADNSKPILVGSAHNSKPETFSFLMAGLAGILFMRNL